MKNIQLNQLSKEQEELFQEKCKLKIDTLISNHGKNRKGKGKKHWDNKKKKNNNKQTGNKNIENEEKHDKEDEEILV